LVWRDAISPQFLPTETSLALLKPSPASSSSSLETRTCLKNTLLWDMTPYSLVESRVILRVHPYLPLVTCATFHPSTPFFRLSQTQPSSGRALVALLRAPSGSLWVPVQPCVPTRFFTRGSHCLFGSLTLKMEAVHSSETSVNVCRTTQRHVCEDSNL
jgi:hypothetical protein